MKIHTTNYTNTFIEVTEDCPAAKGEVPPAKGDAKTVAGMQYEMMSRNPYKFTSDEVFFAVHAQRKDLAESELEEGRREFFSKGQPCFRASPLTKRYGWGVHSDENGRVAIYGVETDEYQRLANNPKLAVVKAMRTGR